MQMINPIQQWKDNDPNLYEKAWMNLKRKREKQTTLNNASYIPPFTKSSKTGKLNDISKRVVVTFVGSHDFDGIFKRPLSSWKISVS